jgi:diguanylate cyclase (GGDEF)-like protein
VNGVLGTRRHRPRQPAAVLVVDLDGFKAVNDTLGHVAGDGLLVQVARTLRASVRPSDTVARLGADEFGVLLVDLPDPALATRIARHLLEQLRNASYLVDGVELSMDAGVGIALVDEGVDGADTVLQRADAAMHRAKRSGGGGVAAYDPAVDTSDVRQLALLVELRQAIENDELELHYQPKARLRTGDLAGVEALVRWRHPTRGLMPPDSFIPLAESTRFIEPLTRWVLRRAIRQAGEWRDAGLLLPVAVNISPRVLLETDFPGTVLDLLADAGVAAELLELEITETAVLSDPDQAFAVCRRLAATGLRISVDDFGAGYTSLSYLRRLPVHTLKLDRVFVTNVVHDVKDRAVVESVVELGHRLGMTVLAEGIEDEEAWHLLRSLGYDEGQGYHLARPMPAADLESWVRSRSAAAAAELDAPTLGDRR